MLPAVRRAALGLTTTLAVVASTAAVPAASADEPTARAEAATDWLAGQLTDGLVISEYQDQDGQWQSFTDYGLTLDTYFAFRDVGVRGRLREDVLDALEPHVEDYVTPFGQSYAGSLAKLITAVQREHRDLAAYEDGDLLTRLEGMVHRGGDADGLAQDAGAPGTTNTFGQAFAVQALARGDSERAADAAVFLLKQQCEAGFFRVGTMSSDRTCDAGTPEQSGSSVDATALAVQALVVVDRRDVAVRQKRVARALAAAEGWLLRKQRESGAFRDAGTANSNSTGLAAAALALLGRDGRADRAAEWIRERQVTRGLAQDGALGGERGAVAFKKAAFDEAVENGIARGLRYEWQRATAQAAAGLDALQRG